MTSHAVSGPVTSTSTRASDPRIGRARWTVLIVAVLVLVPKLILAWRTGGTRDVGTWQIFAAGVKSKGPVGVYSINFHTSHRLYNHPPLVGWLLELLNYLSSVGIRLRFSLRAIASVADVGSALLTFEIVRRRSSLLRAVAAGMIVGASPVLVLISGYHGNTDPIFVALVLLGTFLLVDMEMAILGGAALALALSIKIVPVVVLPALVVYVVKYRRPLLAKTTAGFGVVFIALWAVPVLTQWKSIKDNVLGYSGVGARQWGPIQIARQAHDAGLVQFLSGPGKNLSLILACLIPAAIVWQRGDYAVQGVCLALVVFLALSPAFGVQYLAWALAASCILSVWLGTLYNVFAGTLLFLTYNHWNKGFPWTRIVSGHLTPFEVNVGLVAWFVLVVLVGYELFVGSGLRRVR